MGKNHYENNNQATYGAIGNPWANNYLVCSLEQIEGDPIARWIPLTLPSFRTLQSARKRAAEIAKEGFEHYPPGRCVIP